MWIVQELVLAQVIVICYDDQACTWEELASKILDVDHKNELKKTAEPIMQQRAIRHSNEHQLERLIETFQRASCSEPRDKIFGLLGMAHDCDSDVIEVNYEVSYFDLYSRMIELHKSMPPKFDISADSSWQSIDRPIMLMRFSQLVRRTLGGLVEDAATTREPSEVPKQFHSVRGAVAGEILHLGPTYSETMSSLRANKIWKKAFEGCYQGRTGIERLREEDEAYSRAIIDWDEKRLQTIRAVKTNASYGYRLFGDVEFINLDRDAYSRPDVSEPRRFLATGVLLGFVPPEARVGDLICRFWDCDVAVVVRRIGGDMSDHCMIVGKADISTKVKRPEDYDDHQSMRHDIAQYYMVNGELNMPKVQKTRPRSGEVIL